MTSKKRKRMEIIILITLTVVPALGFYLFDLPGKIQEWQYSLHLTPKKISIVPSQRSTIKSVQITNNNPYPVYSVQLLLAEAQKGSSIEQVKIKPAPHAVPTNFSSTTDLNGFVFSGFNNKTNKKWQRSIIYKIDANSSIDISISFPSTTQLEVFDLKITSFERESDPVFEQKNTTELDFDIK